MALGSDAIELVIRLRAQGYIAAAAAVAEIGAQQLANTFLAARDRLDRAGALFGATAACPLPEPTPTHIVHGSLEHLSEAAPPARDFWRWLGLRYAAIDFGPGSGNLPLDLNCDRVPRGARAAYRLVTNFGTTEHVANQCNAFNIIHDLTALGGVMLHHVPMQGHLNHGLVNYNPKFFWMLARSNGYRMVHANMVADATCYRLPLNIADEMRPFACDIDARLDGYRATDVHLVVVLQKVFDTPYVAPLDVPTGTRPSKALAERYWSVFKPNAFAPPAGTRSRRGGAILAGWRRPAGG